MYTDIKISRKKLSNKSETEKNRNTENNDNDKHISEGIDNIKEDYIIDNNGTKFNLFYNIFNIINTVYREKREIIESRNND